MDDMDEQDGFFLRRSLTSLAAAKRTSSLNEKIVPCLLVFDLPDSKPRAPPIVSVVAAAMLLLLLVKLGVLLFISLRLETNDAEPRGSMAGLFGQVLLVEACRLACWFMPNRDDEARIDVLGLRAA